MLPLPYVLDSSANGPVAITAIGADRLDLSGTDNYGAPAQGFASLIAQMDDRQFVNEAAGVVYQSARTQNSAYADWHWQARACYYEARRRGNIDLYQQAFDQARWSAGL
jgi:hypothetical protein